MNKVKAKAIKTGEWVEGYFQKMNNRANPFVTLENGLLSYEVDPTTICRCVNKEYMDGEIAYEGDIFKSQGTGTIMVLRYGTYDAFCPVDKEYMDSVGFYAEAKGLPDMPIGTLKDYALKIGNIIDNPELYKGSDDLSTK